MVGYYVKGESCSSTPGVAWAGNIAHTVRVGVWVFKFSTGPCTRLSHFTIWKAFDFGVYYQSGNSLQISYNNFIDSHTAVGVIITKENNGLSISFTNFVGQSDSFDCDTDKVDRNANYIKASNMARSPGSGQDSSHSNIAILDGNFPGTNMAPDMSWLASEGNPLANGGTFVENVSFNKYRVNCANNRDYTVRTNPKNEELQHGIYMSKISLQNVDKESKLLMDHVTQTAVGKGIDMATDGLLKVLMKDLDGSWLGKVDGKPLTVVSKAEIHYDNDPANIFKKSDKRIPKLMLVDANGNKIEANKGDNGANMPGTYLKTGNGK
jgi:hypothetical protein